VNRFQKGKPVLFSFIFALFLMWGVRIALDGEIEAFPEFTNVQVQIITQFAGKASEEVERQVTVPLEVATNGIPGLINQRSISLFGLSMITLTFDDSTESRKARLDLGQRLSDAELPEGVKPALSPDTTPVGEIYRYTLKGDLPVDELRLIEDWRLEREFKSIPGVADVVSFGGPVRTIDVKVDPNRIKNLGLTVPLIASALGQNHANAGGAMISHGEESYVVRSLGLYEAPENLETAVISTQKGVPLRIRDIGRVELGHKPRLGIVGRNELNDVVEGIILIRAGGPSLKVCNAISEKIAKLNGGLLPKGVSIEPYYQRTDLIERSSHTVFHNIFFGIALVCVLLLTGLGRRYWAMTLSVALIIPFSLIVVFVILKLSGLTPNLISLGAVDFGIIIETAIFAAEAMIVASLWKGDEQTRQCKIKAAFRQVLGPAFLCALLLIIAFIPILSLQRVEGKIFRPLGITLVAALLGGQIGTFIFMPFAAKFLPAEAPAPNGVDVFFERLLEACVRFGERLKLNTQKISIFGGVLFLILMVLWTLLGREFLPQLNEGALYIRATAPPTISFDASTELAEKIRKRLKTIPEAVDVVSQMGRPDDGTDSNGFDNLETFVSLKPQSEWVSAQTIEGFDVLAAEKLKDLEGIEFNFSQPIKDNVDEAISGVKGELVVKIFGPGLNDLQKLGDQVSEILKSIPGAEDVGTEQLLGQPELRFQMNRDLLARHGLRVTDAEDVLETALMGKVAGRMLDDSDRSIDIVVKPDLPDPPSVSLLSSLPILTGDGAKIPLGEVAEPKLVEGVGRVYRESGERRIAVKCSVRNKPVVEFVAEANRKIASELNLPDKFHLQWSGSFENAERAGHQLLVVVPLCLLGMIVLLFTWFGSWSEVGILMWEIPFATLGGLLFLKLFGLNFSISAAAGLIVLIGVTFLTGMMLLSEWKHLGNAYGALKEKGRSMILSSSVAMIGLIPASFSHGIGSETAKPFAVTILGGLLSSLVLSLLVLPAILARKKV
jgi:cobalt-zinc-cadmium resistance protein CzcA